MFARLTAHGHDPARIPHLTLRQIGLYHGAALRRERQARADRITDVNLGMAGGQNTEKAVRDLRG